MAISGRRTHESATRSHQCLVPSSYPVVRRGTDGPPGAANSRVLHSATRRAAVRTARAREAPTAHVGTVRHAPRPPASSRSSCRSSCRPIAIAPEWKDQQRLWGHAFHPMCSYLASFPAALAHAFIARYSRPGDVVLDPFSGRGTTPLQACAEGRIGVGNDLNPFAHLLTAAKVEPATRAAGRDPARRASPRPGTPDSAGWLALGAAWSPDPGARRRRWSRSPAPATAPTPASETRPGRGRARVPPADARPAAVRPLDAPPRRPDRPVPGRRDHRDPPRQERVVPVGADAEHVQHGPALRARLRARGPAFASPERDVFDGLVEEARPAVPTAPRRRSKGVALLGDARDVAPRARAALRERGRPDRARLVVTSPPYLRVVKYGYYNWLRTWFLGLRRPRDRRDARRRPSPRAVPRVPARRRSPACARS